MHEIKYNIEKTEGFNGKYIQWAALKFKKHYTTIQTYPSTIYFSKKTKQKKTGICQIFPKVLI